MLPYERKGDLLIIKKANASKPNTQMSQDELERLKEALRRLEALLNLPPTFPPEES